MSGTRVGLVCGYLDPTRDGVADYTRRLASHLTAAGLAPVVLTTYEFAATADPHAIGVTKDWDIRGVAAAARAMRLLDFDVVHVQFAPSVFRFSWAIGLLPLFLPRHTPLIVTAHEYGVWSGRGVLGRTRHALWAAAEKSGYADRETLLLARRASCMLTSTREHRDVLQSRLGSRSPALLEVPIGLNLELELVDRDEVRAAVRRELGVAPDAPVVAFFGFLHPEKALDQLIEAVAGVGTQRPGTQLLLIGGATSHSVPSAAATRLRGELEQVAAAHGVQDHVHITGYLPDHEVSRLLQAADAAVFPFDSGVTRKSGSLLAAQAAGVPVVATAVAHDLRQFTESDGVLTVPPGHTATLTDALLRLLTDQDLAERLRVAGRARAARQSWDTIAAAHAEIYARTLAHRRGGEPWTGTSEISRLVPSTRG
jgi:glycosyltransferase involved in cell wall biosynthesis